MNFSRGYSARYYACIVDPVTWTDQDRIELTSGTVSRDTDDLRHSASVETTAYSGERWIRIYMNARQGEDGAHIPIFTGLTATPQRSYDGLREKTPVTCYSVLKPSDDMLLPYGWYAPAGIGIGALIKELLVGPAPVTIPTNTPALSAPIIAEDGETRLTMIDKILTATGWELMVTGYGEIILREPQTEPVLTFSRDFDAVETSYEIIQDWYSAPNCLLVVDGDLTATARDDDPNSVYSTVARGREVWVYESSADVTASESLAEYAVRRLRELQTVTAEVEYTRRYVPDIYPGDILEFRYPGLTGSYKIESQDIDLGYAAKTKEKACRV